MTLYTLGDSKPQLPPEGEYWVAPNASVIGNVILHTNASVWFGAVLRGEETFDGLDALKTQIAADAVAARAVLKRS